MSHPGPAPVATKNSGRVFTIISFVLGVIAILILPIVLGPLGAILGFVGYSKGDKPLGLYAGIFCIVATIAGFVLGAIILANQ